MKWSLTFTPCICSGLSGLIWLLLESQRILCYRSYFTGSCSSRVHQPKSSQKLGFHRGFWVVLSTICKKNTTGSKSTDQMQYTTPIYSPHLFYTKVILLHPLFIFRCCSILPLIMWFQKVDWNFSLSSIKMDCSVNSQWTASIGAQHCTLCMTFCTLNRNAIQCHY